MKTIEVDAVCTDCKGTGLYVGLGERDGAAVVCHTCKGTGCHHIKVEYEPFRERTERDGISRIFQVNPGIVIGKGAGRFDLADFGGMPHEEWATGKPFPPGSENRKYVCPAWWYQAADYKKKPRWPDCNASLGGAFSGCTRFQDKAACWERWDKEQG